MLRGQTGKVSNEALDAARTMVYAGEAKVGIEVAEVEYVVAGSEV